MTQKAYRGFVRVEVRCYGKDKDHAISMSSTYDAPPGYDFVDEHGTWEPVEILGWEPEESTFRRERQSDKRD